MGEQELNQLLWYLVHRHVKRDRAHALNVEDDLFNEARFVAETAIATYDITKKTKLSSYIAACVKNHFSNLKDKDHRRIHFEYADGDAESVYSPFNQTEFEASMKKVLSEDEFAIFYLRYYEDTSVLQIAALLKKTRREVTQCLHHISAKYLSLGKNLDRTLTQRRLTEKFLDSTPNSPNES
jgi:RNA polymerase sigma factor (sigma-70 family)